MTAIQDSAPTIDRPEPTSWTSAQPDLPADHRADDTHDVLVGGDPNIRSVHAMPEAHPLHGTVEQSPRSPMASPVPSEATTDEVQVSPAPAIGTLRPSACTPVLADPLLALAADVLDDLERVRIANENRLRQLTRDEADADGEERGFGLTLDHPDVKRLDALVGALAKAEHDAELNLKRQLRQHPLGPWVKQARGVGEKQAARLLASIGDPYWNDLHQRPRTVSELWAYAGYHVLRTDQQGRDTHGAHVSPGSTGGDPGHRARGIQTPYAGVAASRARGQRANWSANAKMRGHLVAVSIVKAGGPYRDVYDDGRAKYADAVHQVECKRCGPAGKPALPGSPISAGHQHARALRLVAKAVLKDLWREARRLHGVEDEEAARDDS